MKFPKIKTKIEHSGSKPAYKVIGLTLGQKREIAVLDYIDVEALDGFGEIEARAHAEFISFCFDNSESILNPLTESDLEKAYSAGGGAFRSFDHFLKSFKK